VRAALSLGPQRVSIPNVTGQSERAAEINFTRRGLQMGNVAIVSLPGTPGGQIVAQSPMPEAEGVASPKVNLLVTQSTEDKPQYFVMPDFTGRHFGEATSAMAIAGFRVGAVKVTVGGGNGTPAVNGTARNNGRLKPIATDVVASQSPAPGQKVGAGAAINFEVTR
jgi:eukaryotic-like serine/threonine-protein kinase